MKVLLVANGESSTAAPSPQHPSLSLLPQQNATSEDYENHLLLYVSENPNAVLVSPPLIGSNYSSWSRSMRVAL